jgi:cytochrome P450
MTTGFDFLYNAVQSSMTNTTLELWVWLFDHNGCVARGSYTGEVHIMQNVRVIFTADPENVKAILTTQFADYGKGEPFKRDWNDFLGDSIFTTDRKQWHDSRQLIRPMFVRERVGDLDIFEEHVQKLISHLGPGDGQMHRVDKLLSRFTLDAATHFLLGQSTNSIDDETHQFALVFDEVQRMQGLIARAVRTSVVTHPVNAPLPFNTVRAATASETCLCILISTTRKTDSARASKILSYLKETRDVNS